MKILIYGDYYKFTSGYAREIRDILPFLEKNHEVRLVALDYNGYPIDREKYVYHTKTPDVKDRYAMEVLHFALEDFQPDIVLTVQDFWVLPKIAFPLAHPGKWKWIHWGTLDADPLDFYSRESLNWMSYILFQSHFGAIEIKKINPKVIGEVVYPSVDPTIFNRQDKKKLKKQFKLEDFFVFIANARGQQRKNIPVLLDAFKMVLEQTPEAVLILPSGIIRSKTDTGQQDGYDLEMFIQELGIRENVFLPRSTNDGPIDDKTLNIQYNLADVNVLPSIGEGFGLSLIEAGISGVPSIGVDHSAVHEIVKNRGWLIEPKAYMYNNDGSRYHLPNVKDIADKMLESMNDNKKREEYGKEAYNFAKVLTPQSRAEKILEIFEKVIKDDIKPAALR